MNSIESLRTLFDKGYHGSDELKSYFDEFFSLVSVNSYGNTRVLTTPYDMIVFRRDVWRSDTVSLFLDYCIYSNIPFEKIKNMSHWYYADAVYIINDLNIDIESEISSFNTFLQSSFVCRLKESELYYSSYNDDNEISDIMINTLFQFLLVKYDLKLSSIYERNMKNVSLYD